MWAFFKTSSQLQYTLDSICVFKIDAGEVGGGGGGGVGVGGGMQAF